MKSIFFKNIIGQDSVIGSLLKVIESGEVAGSYLFVGQSGVGKRKVGIEFAKAINCESGSDMHTDCVSCSKIDSMNHPDLFIASPEGASNSIKIEKIRNMIYQASLKPYEAKKKVFIITDAECMTKEAQNSILKLLEEPPLNHVLILTSSNIKDLLPTVVSRCKVLKFNSSANEDIAGFLRLKDSSEEEALLYSRMSMGSFGRAMDFKEKNIILKRNQVVNDFFLKKTSLLREDVLKEEGSSTEDSLYILLCWYRDLLVSKYTQDSGSLLNVDRAEELFSYSKMFSEEKIRKDIMSIIDAMDNLEKNVNPKIALFNMALRLKTSN